MSRRSDSMVSFSPVVVITSLVLAACFTYLAIEVLEQDDRSNDLSAFGNESVDNTTDAAYREITVHPRDDGVAAGKDGSLQRNGRDAYAALPQNATNRYVEPASRVASTDKPAVWFTPADEVAQASSATTGLSTARNLSPGALRKSVKVDTQAKSGNQTNNAVGTNTTPARTQPGSGSDASPFDRSSVGAGVEQQQELVAEVAVDLDEMQKIRCYPIDNQGGPPCMCELTIIKQGQTQSELIDNCN